MAVNLAKRLTAQGRELSEVGSLRESTSLVGNPEALRQRMAEDGYIFLRGFLNREDAQAARRDILQRVAAEGALDPDADLMDGVLATTERVGFDPSRTRGSAAIQRLLFQGPMMAFFAEFLGDEVRGFDYVWLRSVSPGFGTKPHGDSVFMNRGTRNLYTAWTPLGEIDLELGGLIVLEGSHRLDEVRQSYGERDVDTFCEGDNAGEVYQLPEGQPWHGQIDDDPVALQTRLGGRWLTATFEPGDLLVFGMGTLHASLDNSTANRLRLSTDTRYQLASESVDERWVGEEPIGHGPEAKRGIIC